MMPTEQELFDTLYALAQKCFEEEKRAGKIEPAILRCMKGAPINGLTDEQLDQLAHVTAKLTMVMFTYGAVAMGNFIRLMQTQNKEWRS
jgi:hypothetical protein